MKSSRRTVSVADAERERGVLDELKDVQRSDRDPQICPPPRPSMAAAFAAIAMPSYDRRFSADWAKENERRAAGQRAEQQRHAGFLARLTKEQEERENREAR